MGCTCMYKRERSHESLFGVAVMSLFSNTLVQVAASIMYWQFDWSVASTSVKSFLTSIGLSMYSDNFTEAGLTQVDDLQWLTTDHKRYKQLQLNDPLHKDYIMEGLKRLRQQRDS